MSKNLYFGPLLLSFSLSITLGSGAHASEENQVSVFAPYEWQRPQPAVRPEFNGTVVTSHVGRGMWIELIMDGRKRLIQDALQYHRIFDGCLKVDPDLYNSFERGPHIHPDSYLAQDQETGIYYFIEAGARRTVPDPKKYCFKLSAAQTQDHSFLMALPIGGNELL